jgi:hypothetical protein
MRGDRFGAFDGRFLGIDLGLSDPQSSDDFPWLSPAQLTSAEAMPVLSRVNPEATLSGLLEATTVTHELRHFHDFLLSPLGAYALRARYMAALNTIPLLAWFKHQAGVLPVPLSTWMTMPPIERDTYWERASKLWAAAGRSLPEPIPLPYVPAISLDAQRQADQTDAYSIRKYEGDAIAEAIVLVAGQFARAEYVLGGIEIEGEQWNPAQLFEIGAVTAQSQHLRLTTNSAVANGVFTQLAGSQTVYGAILRRLAVFLGGSLEMGVQISMPHASALATYALLGSCEPTNFYCQPVVRFSVIAKHLYGKSQESLPPFREVFEEWDSVLDAAGVLTRPTFEGIKESLDMDAAVLRMLDATAEESPKTALPIMLTFMELVEARRQLCERFLDDPDAYLRPKSYLGFLPSLPRPVVRITSPAESGHALERTLEAAGWTSCVRANEWQVLANPPPTFLPGKESFRLDTFDSTSEAVMAAEAIFADNPAVTEVANLFFDRLVEGRIPLLRVARPRRQTPGSIREGASRFSL